MADDLVENVRFFGIVSRSGMADVLCRAEDSVGKRIQEIPLAENTMDRFNSETGGALKILTKMSHLGDSVSHLHSLL